MVWATTASINQRSIVASTALSAVSAAAVARGDSAVTDYDDLIATAHAQVFEREMDRAQPIDNVKGSGMGFRWQRG